MNVALRPYNCSTPARRRRSPLNGPFDFGSSLLDDFLRLTDGGRIDESSSRFQKRAFPINVKESEAGYALEIALPGLSKEEIDLAVEDGTLKIDVKPLVEASEGECQPYASQEWNVSTGVRTLTLPADANPESLHAVLKDGVLRLEIGKLEEKQPRKVEIK